MLQAIRLENLVGKMAGDRVRFEVADARSFLGAVYDLAAFFDCLHDMGVPVGAAHHVREGLSPGGTWLIVEPFAGGFHRFRRAAETPFSLVLEARP